MHRISRFVIWICNKFNREEIIKIIEELIDILQNRNPDVKPRDDFKEKHPNYRDFKVDPLPPLSESPEKIVKPQQFYKSLFKEYEAINGKSLKPVSLRNNSQPVPKQISCPNCKASHNYLYQNNGKKRSQLKCKVCGITFNPAKRFQRKNKYFCPYCFSPLYKWKTRDEVEIYKCGNRKCPYRTRELNKLNQDEKELIQQRSSQFKINYQFREYQYKIEQLDISQPIKPNVDLTKIHNNINVVALILTFHISYAITARKTAHILRNVFNLKVSYQTVINYANAAAYYCHQFNLKNKGDIDKINPGDETYIKVMGKNHYVWFFMSAISHKITAYHVSDNRGANHAIKTMLEALRTAKPEQKITMVTDGNPSYQAGLHFINANLEDLKVILRKVIGLQNLDQESETYRPYKQMIERLNRTYKYHVQPASGFGVLNGAVCKTVLFVTHYNFIRGHMALGYKAPIELHELQYISNTQGKWTKILAMAA